MNQTLYNLILTILFIFYIIAGYEIGAQLIENASYVSPIDIIKFKIALPLASAVILTLLTGALIQDFRK